MSDKFLILDANSILHRAFHALPPLATKKGEKTNAIYGFLLVFFKLMRELEPKYVCACFDFPAKTFRHQKFKDYKIFRPPTPEDLKSQIKKTKEILEAFNVPFFEKEGYEADDLVATIVEKSPGISKIIVSGDRDLFQVVNEETKIYFLQKGIKNPLLVDKEKIKERFSFSYPEQIVDFKALVGDPSDNIPGIKGIGEKTAISLISQFKNLDNLYKEIERIEQKPSNIKPKIIKELLTSKEKVLFNRELARLKKDVEIDFDLKKCLFGDYDRDKVVKILKELEFKSLIKRITENKTDRLNQEKLF
jgi:DNA polymerase-1